MLSEVAKAFDRKVWRWRVHGGHLHDAGRALSSPSRWNLDNWNFFRFHTALNHIRVCVITLFPNIFSYCSACWASLQKFLKWKSDNAARALPSPSRCFQLSTNLDKDFFRYLRYCGKEQIECGLTRCVLLSVPRESTKFWPLWWRVSLSIRVHTMLNNIRFVFYRIISTSKKLFRARAKKGIARHIDASSVVWTLIVNGKLANQIARLAAILVKLNF